MHTQTHLFTCTHTHKYSYVHAHTNAHKHTHIQTHTHTNTQSPGYHGLVAAGGLGAGYLLVSLSAGELELHPPHFPWSHNGPFSALDHQR